MIYSIRLNAVSVCYMMCSIRLNAASVCDMIWYAQLDWMTSQFVIWYAQLDWMPPQFVIWYDRLNALSVCDMIWYAQLDWMLSLIILFLAQNSSPLFHNPYRLLCLYQKIFWNINTENTKHRPQMLYCSCPRANDKIDSALSCTGFSFVVHS